MWKIEYATEAIKQLVKLSSFERKHTLLKIEELAKYDKPTTHPQVKY